MEGNAEAAVGGSFVAVRDASRLHLVTVEERCDAKRSSRSALTVQAVAQGDRERIAPARDRELTAGAGCNAIADLHVSSFPTVGRPTDPGARRPPA